MSEAVKPAMPQGNEVVEPNVSLISSVEADIQEVATDSQTLTWFERARNVGRVGIVGAVVLPVNEFIRFGAAGVVQAMTGNTLASGATLGVVTFAVEGLGARSASNLMDTNYGGKVLNWLSDKKDKVLKDRRMSWPVEALVAYGGGSAVVVAAKSVEDPTRSLEQNKRHGDITAGWLSSVVSLQWVAGGNAIQNPSPLNIGVAVASTAGAYAGVKLAQRHEQEK